MLVSTPTALLTHCVLEACVAGGGSGVTSLSTVGDVVGSGVRGGGGVYAHDSLLLLQGTTLFIRCSAPRGGGGGLLWAHTGKGSSAEVPVQWKAASQVQAVRPLHGDGAGSQGDVGSSNSPLRPVSGVNGTLQLGWGNTALFGPFVASVDHHSGTGYNQHT